MKVLILLSMAFSSRQNRSSRSSWAIRLRHAWKLHPALPWQWHTTVSLSCTTSMEQQLPIGDTHRLSSSSDFWIFITTFGKDGLRSLRVCVSCVVISGKIRISMYLLRLYITIELNSFLYEQVTVSWVHPPKSGNYTDPKYINTDTEINVCGKAFSLR